QQLRPDLSATAEIITDSRRGALSVPIIALTVRDAEGKRLSSGDEDDRAPGTEPAEPANDEGVEGVFLIHGDTVAFVPVEVGITGEQYFEVRSGLRGGEAVVSGSYQAIRELETGAKVRIPAATKAPPRKARSRS
nr:secretion protein HlyD [Gemmatimonadota bacterium]